MTILIEQVAGSAHSRNTTMRISGLLNSESAIELETKHGKLKLTSALWLIEEKMGFYLCWDFGSVIMPMESRNSIRFDQAIPCPDKWQGTLWLKPFKFIPPAMAFLVVLDFDK